MGYHKACFLHGFHRFHKAIPLHMPVNEENLDIHKIVNNIDESKLYVNMASFEHKVVNEKELQCFQPKILICKDDTDIKIYHFDVRQPMRNPRREILLIDDNKNSKRYGD